MIVFQLTAARRRLRQAILQQPHNDACFNSQPPEGGCETTVSIARADIVSTHSRPKAAARIAETVRRYGMVSTHSRPKAAAYGLEAQHFTVNEFQLTAARRRLPAAYNHAEYLKQRFNSQPPEGGCDHRPALPCAA